jgi:nitroimidazol reductase NimA-like FMN-containing flavoprotein (pyridoxamine 5'-phosphate oxidase superfamily)
VSAASFTSKTNGPVAVPVNYALAGSDIGFRVAGGTKQAAVSQPLLTFEVDHIDDDERSAWSVLARGKGHEVEIEDVSALLRQIEGPPPQPWAGGVHNVWLQITPQTLTGRRLEADGRRFESCRERANEQVRACFRLA